MQKLSILFILTLSGSEVSAAALRSTIRPAVNLAARSMSSEPVKRVSVSAQSLSSSQVVRAAVVRQQANFAQFSHQTKTASNARSWLCAAAVSAITVGLLKDDLSADVVRADGNWLARYHVIEDVFKGQDEKKLRKVIRLGLKSTDDNCMLSNAIRNDNVLALRIMVQEGFNINRQGWINSGYTPMHEAADSGAAFDFLKTIKELGGDVNGRNKHGWTPLHAACHSGVKEGVIRSLVALGADVSVVDDRGRTALFYADLMPAAVKELVQVGINVNAADKDGNTALHTMVTNYHNKYQLLKSLDILATAGVNLGAKNNQGKTALQVALDDVAKSEAYAKAESSGSADKYFSDRCKTVGNNVIALVLVGADFDDQFIERWGAQALKDAMWENRLDIARRLLDAQVPVQEDAWTGAIIKDKSCQLVQELLNRKIYSKFALRKSISCDNPASSRLIIQSGLADLNEFDEYGETPLTQAVKYGVGQTVQDLIATGKVDLHKANKQGETIAMILKSNQVGFHHSSVTGKELTQDERIVLENLLAEELGKLSTLARLKAWFKR